MVAALGIAGYFIYQQPEVKVLFQPAKAPPKDPLSFLKKLPEIHPPTPTPRRKPVRPSTTPSAAVDTTEAPAFPADAEAPEAAGEPSAANQVPNDELARLLLQVLAAKRLVTGISIGVSDTEVLVHGEVASQERLDEIRRLLEKGRESRTLNLSGVKIVPDREK